MKRFLIMLIRIMLKRIIDFANFFLRKINSGEKGKENNISSLHEAKPNKKTGYFYVEWLGMKLKVPPEILGENELINYRGQLSDSMMKDINQKSANGLKSKS